MTACKWLCAPVSLFAIVVGALFCVPVQAENATEGQSLAAQLAAANSLLSVRDDGEGDEDSGSSNNYWKEHFQLHGYVTTAYAELNDQGAPTPSGDERILGLESDGTLDYRIAALQLRYDPNPRNTFVVQLSHRRLGDSPLKEVDDDVELDWAFYQFRFTDNTSIKIGRVPVPLGIFNEYRDVGVLLPFFRPSFNFYREGSFVSETVDGAVLSHSITGNSDWSLDLDAFYGEWDLVEAGGANTNQAFEAEVTGGYGLQLWLNTPVQGLRFGAGAQSYDVGPESGFNDDEETWDTWYASIDGVFEKFIARAEYKYIEFPVANNLFLDGESEVVNYYFQLGWLINDKLSIYGQAEYGDVEQTQLNLLRPADFTQRDDLGFSVVYAFLSNLVFKAEYHQTEFELVTSVVPVFDGGLVKLDLGFTEFESEYSIISLSASF